MPGKVPGSKKKGIKGKSPQTYGQGGLHKLKGVDGLDYAIEDAVAMSLLKAWKARMEL
jgi:hypothetical protein